jgi:dTMP kinase
VIPHPIFVVFEGADICGKTTQAELLTKRLVASGRPTRSTTFPRYDTKVGKAISRHLRGMLLVHDFEKSDTSPFTADVIADEDDLYLHALHTLDRYEEAPLINAELAAGTSVVSSRWWQSMEVYGADSGIDLDNLERSHSLLPRADLNVLLNLSEEESLRRRPELRDRNERDRDKQQRVRAAYVTMWEHEEASDRVAWLRVDGDHLTEEQVHAMVWDRVQLVIDWTLGHRL